MSARSGGAGTPLHVAQLVETLDMGGAEHLAVQVANARAAAGDLSHLYVLTEPGILAARISPAVPVRYLGYRRASLAQPHRFLPSLVRGYRLLSRQLRADGIQVVQTHLPGANFWGLLLALRECCAVVGTIHNNAEFRYGEDSAPVRARLRRQAYAWLLRRAAAVVAVSEDVRSSLVEELELDTATAARLVVVPNGVLLPAELSPAVQAAVRRRYGLPMDVPLVLAAGRLTEQKNFGALVEAAARLRPRFPTARFLIAGEGEQRASLQARIGELGLSGQMHLAGNVTDLVDLMRAADLFVLPSLWEGLPLVLLEAMAARLAVVATRIRGVAEVVRDGENGRLVPPGDVAALSEAIGDLLDHAEARSSLARSARETIAASYSFERVAAQLGDIYRRVAVGAR